MNGCSSRLSDEIERLRTLLHNSQRAVVFTGAGMSTDSGIPDFRGPQGLWKHVKPIPFQDFVSSEAVRQHYWKQWFEHSKELLSAKPNFGHRIIARLVESGDVAAVITQNVDNLHQVSGIPADKVIELHGNSTYAKCLGCARRREMSDIEAELARNQEVKPCAECGGIIKTATISFGQQMPDLPMRRAAEEVDACDLVIVLGSSLTVYPAASFPQIARDRGAQLVIINNEPTELDAAADLVLHAGISEVLGAVLEAPAGAK